MLKSLIHATVPAAIAAGILLGTTVVQYADTRIPSDEFSGGRTRNALAAIIAPEVARRLYGNSSFEMQIVKSYFPDAQVIGSVSESVRSDIKLLFSSVHYTASGDPLQGKVDKSEYDWKVEELPDGRLHISRFGPKWDTHLSIEAENGTIDGKYDRRGIGAKFDWEISGTYDADGNVKVNVGIPFGPDISLEGRIEAN